MSVLPNTPLSKLKDLAQVRSNDEYFCQIMELIDAEIRQENESSSFFGRELQAVGKFTKMYGIRLNSIDPLFKKITGWFSERYGERLKLHKPIGESAILIRKEPYKVDFPMCFGVQAFECDPDTLNGSNKLSSAINILNHISGITEGYAKALTQAELKEIFLDYMSLFKEAIELDAVKQTEFITAAKSDIKASIDHLFDNPISFGLSKWASLQATEKFLKAFISHKGMTPLKCTT